MHRCYTPGADFATSSLPVEGEEARHALRVMRLRPGDELEVFDGEGHSAVAQLVQAEGNSAMQLKVLRLLPELPPVAQITLAIAIPKGANMDLIAQKAVELGACRIIPLVTERTIARPGAGEATAKAAKWQRTVLEACKQSGVNRIPMVEPPQPFPHFLQRTDLPALKLQCAITPTARPMRETLEAARAGGHRAAVILIGPEGDFSPAEYTASAVAGYAPISLGPIILRVETAAFMALSAARYALD